MVSEKKSFNKSNLDTIIHQGKKRSFEFIQPKNNMVNEIPLIIALHGYAGNSNSIDYVSKLSEYVDKDNFYLVYPNGYSSSDQSSFYSWNTGFCCGSSYRDNSDDVGYIKSIIYFLIDNYKIDKNRILVTGMSNGGMMAHKVGAELGDIISAIAPIAGTIGGKMPSMKEYSTISKPKSPLSVIIFHGNEDSYVPYFGGKGKGNLESMLSVDDSINFWLRYSNCSPFPERKILANGNVVKEEYSGGEDNTKVILYTIKNGTHSWPGGRKGLQSEGDPISASEFSASQVIIDFIKNIEI